MLLYVALNALIVLKVVRPKEAVQHIWIHRKIACLYDSLNMRTTVGKAYILLPYAQKLLIALFITLSLDPLIVLSLITVLKLLPYFPTLKWNPYTVIKVQLRELATDLMDIWVIFTSIMFSDYY